MEFGKLFKIHQLFKKEGVSLKNLVFGESKIKDTDTVITWQGDDIMVGEPVFVVTDEGELPAPDGKHLLEDGRTVVVEGGMGVVSEIMEAGAEVEAPAETPAEAPTDVVVAPELSANPSAPISKEEIERTITERVKKFEDETNEKHNKQIEEITAKFKAENDKLLSVIDEMAEVFKKSNEKPAVAPAKPVKAQFGSKKETKFDKLYSVLTKK